MLFVLYCTEQTLFSKVLDPHLLDLAAGGDSEDEGLQMMKIADPGRTNVLFIFNC